VFGNPLNQIALASC